MMDVERQSLPLYLQVKLVLKEQIEKGEYPRGSQIPPEPQLEKIFHVSRITIRQAITELAAEGYVRKERGRGTRVTYSAKINEKATAIRSFTTEIQDQGMEPGTAYVKMEKLIPSRRIQYLLELGDEEETYHLVRIRTADKKPIVVFETYIPGHFDLSTNAKLYEGSMYEQFAKAHIGYPCVIKETFSSMLADNALSKALQIETGCPILKRIRLSLNENNEPIEYTISYYRGDTYEYSIELHDR